MNERIVDIGKIPVGEKNPLVLLAGPCVIESEKSVMEIAEELVAITEKCGMNFVFKASYDKANRTSISSYRGLGIEKGIEILNKVKTKFNVPVVSDVHLPSEVAMVKDVLDIIQIPAFLCRQTDILVEAAKSGKVVNVKKGQFLSPGEMKNVVKKLEDSGCEKIMLTERGTSFGYNMLVNDFRGVPIMKETGCPVIFDATHSVQMPGGAGDKSSGESKYALTLAKAAVACGVDGLFLEVHKDPAKALSDGPNMVKLDDLEFFIKEIQKIEKAVRL